MRIDRRITNGLAWAGVALVVGVPVADLLSAQLLGREAPPTVAVIEPVLPTPAPAGQRPAAPVVAPASEVAALPTSPIQNPNPPAPAAQQTADVVDQFLQSGKPLPSYITGSDAPAPVSEVAATPPVRTPIVAAPVVEPAQPDPTQVAAIPPKVAPIPMPLSMRPPAPLVAELPPEPLIIPDSVVAPLPPANVTAADLEDWETGPLSEFLAARQQQGGSSATVTYDRDGFWLDEGPNAPRDRYIGPADDEVYFVPFGN